MALCWNEIRMRAIQFAKEWEQNTSEDAETKSFWDQFFSVFGITRRRVATFEHKVPLPGQHGGYIDVLWKGVIMVEHKSRGRDLDKALTHAKDYFPGLAEEDLPRFLLTSDFARFRLYDLWRLARSTPSPCRSCPSASTCSTSCWASRSATTPSRTP